MRHYAFDPCMTTNAFDPTMEMTGNAAHVDCPRCVARLAKWGSGIPRDPDESIREAIFRPPLPTATVVRHTIPFPVDVYVVDGQITGAVIALGATSHVEHIRRVLAGFVDDLDETGAEGGAQ